MYRFVLIVATVVLALFTSAQGQRPMAKENGSASMGIRLRLIPANNGEWFLYSTDSMIVSRLSGCGNVLWTRRYSIPTVSPVIKGELFTSDNCLVVMTMATQGSAYQCILTKIDQSGNVLWSNTYTHASFTAVPYSLFEDLSGNLVVFQNMGDISGGVQYNAIVRIRPNGQLIRADWYDHGGIWGGAILTPDNGVLFRTGSILVRTDASGNVNWSRAIPTTSQEYYAPLKVNDGFLVPLRNPGNSILSFAHLNEQGDTIGPGVLKSNYSGASPLIRQRPNGNLLFLFTGVSREVVEVSPSFQVIGNYSFPSSGSLNASIHDVQVNEDNVVAVAGSASGGRAIYFSLLDDGMQSACGNGGGNFFWYDTTITYSQIPTTHSNGNVVVVANTITATTLNFPLQRVCAPVKSLYLGADRQLCGVGALTLGNTTPDRFYRYLWSTGDTTAQLTVNTGGVYWLQVSDSCGELMLTDTLLITEKAGPQLEPGPDVYLCSDSTAAVVAPVCDLCLIKWSTGQISDTLWVRDPGVYWLQVTDTEGCVAADTFAVFQSACSCDLFFPNCFTPNLDTKNEFFGSVSNCEIAEWDLRIYNRWGQLVFASSQVEDRWDGSYQGKKAMEGIYVYQLAYRPVLKGRVSKKLSKNGTVLVLR